MPEAAERALKATARKRGYGKKRTGRYVYGTLRNMGWKPSREKNSIIEGIKFICERGKHAFK